jgi:hypothetical protein
MKTKWIKTVDFNFDKHTDFECYIFMDSKVHKGKFSNRSFTFNYGSCGRLHPSHVMKITIPKKPKVCYENETIYSKKEFEGFTHRFIVKLTIDDDFHNDTNIHLYSNSDSYEKLEEFINVKKVDKVVAFNIIHRASKAQDDMANKLIEETLSDIHHLNANR